MDYLVKRPMLSCAIISVAAVVAGCYSKFILFLIGVGVIALIFTFHYKQKSAYFVVFLFVFAVIVSEFYQIAKTEEIKYYNGNTCYGEYTVITEPKMADSYYTATVEVLKSDFLEKGTKISVIYNGANIEFSDIIKADITIKSAKTSAYFYSQKIYCNGTMKSVVKTGKRDFVLDKVRSLRKYISFKIHKNFGYAEFATILALITSDKSYFSNEFYNNVKSAGVAHIMVVSGLHLSIIVTFLLAFTKKIFYNRYLKAFTIFLAVILVSTVAGFSMSVLRAGVTYILISVSFILNRPNTPSNTLGTAVSILLINNPFAVFNVAFQLSVLSTFGILAVAIPIIEFVKQAEYIKSKLLFSLFSAGLITLSATVLTLPVLIYNFGYVSNVFLITNLLICTPVTVAVCLVILGLITPFGKVFFFAAGIVVKYINFVINCFGSLKFAVTRLNEWTGYVSVAVVILILFGLATCKKHLDMLKSEQLNNKRIKESGGMRKWRSFLKKL
ncbi:MAG: ComEC/Rec2 family competence protein [Acutalibacteraceae bacterium]|nr:ComEC/Rec2 family competence protein [Acutalibacteraceae bacterium]